MEQEESICLTSGSTTELYLLIENYIIENFCIYVHQRYWSTVLLLLLFFSCNVFGFGRGVMLDSWVGKLPSASIFWKRLQKIGIISSLNVQQNSPVKSSEPDTYCLGRLLIVDSISLIDIVLFRLPISFCVRFGKRVLQGTSPLLLNYKICGHKVVCSISLLTFQCP